MLQIQNNHKNRERLSQLKAGMSHAIPSYPSFKSYTLFFETGDRSVFEKDYFQRRKQLTRLGLLCLGDPNDKENLQQLEDMLFSVCQEFTWSLPAHVIREKEENDWKRDYTLDLFACETGYTLAELITLLDKQLSESIKAIVKATINERVFKPFLKEEWKWETLDNNWASVCAGSVGAAALYLVEEEEILTEILERVEKAMTCYLSGFGEDGACLEGIGYWQYGFRYFTYFADMYLTYSKDEKNLFDQDKVENMAQFQQKMILYDKTVINYSDSPAEIEPAYDLAFYYHKMFPENVQLPNETFEADQIIDQCGRWAPAVRMFAWEADLSSSSRNMDRTNEWMEDAQIFVHKNGDLSFSCKGGHNDESHNHIDLGQFILHYDKKPCFIDLGSPVYTKDYFSEKRYETLHASAKGHSVPVINGKEQTDGKEAYAEVVSVSADKPEICFDLTHAYPDEKLEEYRRRFIINEETDQLVINEGFKFKADKNEVVLRYILSSFDSIEMKASSLVLINGTDLVELDFSNHSLIYDVSGFTYIDNEGREKAANILEIKLTELERESEFTITVTCQKKENRNDTNAGR